MGKRVKGFNDAIEPETLTANADAPREVSGAEFYTRGGSSEGYSDGGVTPAEPAAPAPGVAPMVEQSLSLDDVPSGELPKIQWPAGRFYMLCARALRHEQSALLKLSKSADDAGYPIEARAIRADALLIGAEMLPTFEAQTELPLATEEELAAGIINAVRQLVVRHVKPASETIDHEAVLLRDLGSRIADFAIELANTAYNAGRIVRENEPEVFAIRALKDL